MTDRSVHSRRGAFAPRCGSGGLGRRGSADMAEPDGSGGERVATARPRTVASPGHASRHGPHGEDAGTPAGAMEDAGPPRRTRRRLVAALAVGAAAVLGAW